MRLPGLHRPLDAPEVLPSDARTQVLCLRAACSIAALETVPELANSGSLKGALTAPATQYAALGDLIRAAWAETVANAGDGQGHLLRELKQYRVRVDPNHAIGNWMQAEFPLCSPES